MKKSLIIVEVFCNSILRRAQVVLFSFTIQQQCTPSRIFKAEQPSFNMNFQ